MVSTCPFLHYQNSEHSILKMDELMLLQIGTSGPWGKGMKQ